MTTNPNTPLAGQTPQSGDPPGQTPTTPPPTPGQTPPPSHSQTTPASGQSQQQTPITSLPPDIQDYIKRLRDEAEEANKAKKAEAKAKAEAEAARLKKQGEFEELAKHHEELAKQHEKRIQELEPIAESYTRLASTMNTQIEAEIKDWPPEVKSLVPPQETVLSSGERRVTPVEERLEHILRLRPLLEKLQVQARGTLPGNSPNPRPSGQTPEDMGKEYDRRLRASAKYGA